MRQTHCVRFLSAGVLPALAWTIAMLFGATACRGADPAAASVRPGEMRQRDQWLKDRLLGAGEQPAVASGRPAFSFVYGEQPSAKLLADWPRKSQTDKLPKDRTQHTLTWTDAKTGLEVRCVAVEYADFPVVEWTVYFKNGGRADTPILANVQAIDARIERAAGRRVPAQVLQGRHRAARTCINRSNRS